MEEKEIDEVLAGIKKELLRANKKHGEYFHSAHEGYGVLLEEVDELWDDIKDNLLHNSIDEAIQVGAMAVKYVVSINKKLSNRV